jgi:hypothetical protein
MLTGDNYTVWAIKVEANLDVQDVWEAVVPADSTATVDPEKNKRARAYLLGALSEDILLQVSSKKKAAEVWASLKTRFIGADRVRAARLSTLRGDFDRLNMGDGEALDVFAGKISSMAARYANLGATLDDVAMARFTGSSSSDSRRLPDQSQAKKRTSKGWTGTRAERQEMDRFNCRGISFADLALDVKLGAGNGVFRSLLVKKKMGRAARAAVLAHTSATGRSRSNL